MAATAITTTMAGAINYTYVTDSSADWASVPNSTYFYDKADKLVHYKDSTGIVQEVYKQNPAVQSVTSSATVTATSLNDLVKITAQAAALALANPTGTFAEGQALIFRIKDNGTARAISFDTKFRAVGVTLPTTTTISKTTYVGCIYNSTDDKFDVIASLTEA
jgi:Flp pilus assembly secretin CpaC